MIFDKKIKYTNFENIFPFFMENVDDIIIIADPTNSFKIEYIHQCKFLEQLGYSENLLIGKSLLELVDFGDGIPEKNYTSIIQQRKSRLNIKVINKIGNLVWAELNSTLFTDDKDQQKLIIILKDISKIKESEEKYRDTVELLPDIIYEADLDLNLTYVNSIAFEKFGYTPGDLISGLNINQLIDLKYKEKAYSKIKLLFEGKEIPPNDYLMRKKDGSTFYARIHSRPIVEDGHVIGIRGTITDINDMIFAEEKLKESEEKFRTIAEQSLMGICIIQDFGIKYINQQMADIYGYPLSEIRQWKAKEFLKVIHPDSKQIAINQLTKKQQGSDDVIIHYIAKIIKKNGNIRYVENYSKPINYQGRTADLLTQIDITAKMNAEQKLKESEEKYRSLFENMNAGFAYHKVIVNDNNDPIDYKYLEVNPGFEKLTGMKKENLIGKTVTEAIPGTENDPADWIGKFGKVGLTGIPLTVEDYSEAIDKWFKVSGYSPKKSYFAVTFTDITDRKKAEEKLKESEEKYRLISENANDLIIVFNEKFEYEYINENVHKRILGYTKNDLIGKIQLPFIHPDDRKQAIIATGKVLRKGRGSHSIRFKHKDGSYKWLDITGKNFVDSKGIKKTLAIARDITNRKEAEEKLKESEAKYRDLLETSSIGVMELDVINKKMTYINPKLLIIIGYDKKELTEEVFRNDIIHPQDLIKLLRNNEESELEFRVKDKSGKLKWLSGKRIPHYNENGEISSIRLWLDDITEKKMYEELIYELNINFLNFTADIRKNLQLLLNTCLKLLNGDLILYYQKNLSDNKELFQVLTSDNKVYSYDFKDLKKDHFINKLFSEDHDFPQSFIDIDKMKYAKSDPFIIDHKFKGCFGKLIKSHSGLKSAVCVFYNDNPIISGQEKLVLFLICDAIEIEQRRWRVQRDLEKQNVTLEKINKLKTDLFSRTSHELKTPLISIKGFTELLLTLHKHKLDAEVISILNEIKGGGERLEKIIKLLLESTKLEAGQLELNLSQEDLTFLIKFCFKELQGLAKLRSQSISLNLHNKLITKFDKERIYEVISNLLLNAIKYTPPNGNISIQSEINNDFYIISIKDNGIGFTKEEKSKVFKQFGKIERYGQGWDIATDGTGLGLYITKKLVELHGGKVWLESEGRNKGSTFYFSIPNKEKI